MIQSLPLSFRAEGMRHSAGPRSVLGPRPLCLGIAFRDGCRSHGSAEPADTAAAAAAATATTTSAASSRRNRSMPSGRVAFLLPKGQACRSVMRASVGIDLEGFAHADVATGLNAVLDKTALGSASNRSQKSSSDQALAMIRLHGLSGIRCSAITMYPFRRRASRGFDRPCPPRGRSRFMASSHK